MKQSSLLLILILFSIGLVSCSGKGTEPGNTKADAVGEPAKSATIAAENPSQATKNFLEAVRDRRYSEIRDMLSQRSISNLNEASNRIGTNLDQALKRIVDNDAANMAANNNTTFETRNEDVRGQSATVEAKAINAPQFARISLTREGDRWKVNIDETAPVQ